MCSNIVSVYITLSLLGETDLELYIVRFLRKGGGVIFDVIIFHPTINFSVSKSLNPINLLNVYYYYYRIIKKNTSNIKDIKCL